MSSSPPLPHSLTLLESSDAPCLAPDVSSVRVPPQSAFQVPVLPLLTASVLIPFPPFDADPGFARVQTVGFVFLRVSIYSSQSCAEDRLWKAYCDFPPVVGEAQGPHSCLSRMTGGEVH